MNHEKQKNLLEVFAPEVYEKEKVHNQGKVLKDFMDYYIGERATGDIDPEYPILNYVKRELHLNEEELLWYCWIYGCVYHETTTHFIFQELSEPMPPIDRFRRWFEATERKLQYGHDRWQARGKMPKMYESYKRHVDNYGSQADLLKDRTYTELWKLFKTRMFNFGSYSTIIYLETLKRCAGFDIDQPASTVKQWVWSPKRGLRHIFNLPETTSNEELQQNAEKLSQILKDRVPAKIEGFANISGTVDYEYMETVLCAFRGACENHRYVGYYIDRMQENLTQMQRSVGQKFPLLWESRANIFPEGHLGELHGWKGIRKPLLKVYTRTGKVVDLEPTKRLI